MIIFGWGRRTRKLIGKVFEKLCPHCNRTEIWQLCIQRTWFTLFFIPLIPYKTMYCVTCPSCGSYVEMTKEVFEQMKQELLNPSSVVTSGTSSNSIPDSLRYSGKTKTQINYLKSMEEFNNK